MSKSEIFAWACATFLCIAVWMQIAMNHEKSKRIERLESCIDAMIERQNNTNTVEKAKFIIAK